MLSLLVLLALGLLVLGGCGSMEWPPPGPGPQDINIPPGIPGAPRASSPAFAGAGTVVAGRGDTVYGLARRHRVSVRAIIDANRLSPPYYLKAGQRVLLPRGRRHVVSRGDTLYALARQYRINPHALARANGLKPPYTIHSGQKLILPSPLTRPAARPVAKPGVRGGETGLTKTAKSSLPRARRKLPLPDVPQPPAASSRGFIWPVKGRVVSSFGAKAKGLRNDGINIAAQKGAPVKAAEKGVVAYAGNELRGFGNLLLIKHAGGWVTAYAHNDTLLVKRGQSVGKGQRIATVGSTGSVKIPQLHFEMRRGRTPRDPRKYLRTFRWGFSITPVTPARHGKRSVQRLAQPPGQVLDELPGNTARARAPGHRPFIGLAGEVDGGLVDAKVLSVALDDGEEGFLVAVVEAEPQPEAVRKRHLFLHRFRRVNGGRAFVFDHVPGHQVAAVRSSVEDDVSRPALDAAFQNRLQ